MSTTTSRRTRRYPRLIRFSKPAMVLLSAGLGLLAAELGFRGLESQLGVSKEELQSFRRFLATGHQLYRPYPYVNFLATPQSPEDSVSPTSWAFGFPEGDTSLRVACLGASTTWGTYPQQLQELLDKFSEQPARVMNWGVPGWTTLETMVNYFAVVQDYRPDIVILHHAINDGTPRMVSGYRTDNGHWRKTWSDVEVGFVTRLFVAWSDLIAYTALRRGEYKSLGTLVTWTNRPPARDPLNDKSERGFERNIRTIAKHVRSRGGQVVLATQPYSKRHAFGLTGEKRMWAKLLDQHNGILRRIAQEENCILVDLEAAFPTKWGHHFIDHVHLKPLATRWEARLLLTELVSAGAIALR